MLLKLVLISRDGMMMSGVERHQLQFIVVTDCRPPRHVVVDVRGTSIIINAT